jgi:hypothetical protein
MVVWNKCIGKLTQNATALGGGAFGEEFSYKGSALMSIMPLPKSLTEGVWFLYTPLFVYVSTQHSFSLEDAVKE